MDARLERQSRRSFLAAAGMLAGTAAISGWAQDPPAPFRAAVVGHTGRGNYGHSLDVAFTGVPGIEVAAVADPVAEGRAKAMRSSGAARGYADWREMLAREKPNLVCLAPRWSEHRHEMGMAALGQGAHLLTEKPFTVTLAEADGLLALAGRKNLKIATAHQMRTAESVRNLKRALDGGLLGRLLRIHSWGKQDARAGGEDMMVLGTHIFDMIRLFAGDCGWCSARVLEEGRDITAGSGRTVREQIGPVAGREIYAHFGFPNGVNAAFTSDARLRETFGPWGMELIGTKGRARVFVEIYSSVYLHRPGQWSERGRSDEWVRWEGDPGRELSREERGFIPANRRVVDDLIEAIREDREPFCSGYNGMKAIEMAMAVYWSALRKERVPLPLKDRGHPLAA